MIGAVKQRAVRVARTYRPGNRWRLDADRFAMYWHVGEPNFGDVLSPLIIGAHVPRTPSRVSSTFAAKVVGLGSVARHIAPGDLVIGTGSVDGTPIDLPARTEVLAVRGPRTATALGLRGDVAFGDPGLLAAEVMAPASTVPEPGRIAVVPHHVHLDATRRELESVGADPDQIVVLDLLGSPQQVMDEIGRAETVIASALHGIIAAESVGRPVRWFEIAEPLKGGHFKFHDHFEASGRHGMQPLDLGAALAAARAGDVEPANPATDGIRAALAEAARLLA